MASPLKRPLDIELYNDKYFPTNFKHIIKPSLDQESCHIDTLAFQKHNLQPEMSTAQSLGDESKVSFPSFEVISSKTLGAPHDTLDMSDELFFIEFTPEGTL